eukprot:8824026-Pyramimonas_sp.AAC.1
MYTLTSFGNALYVWYVWCSSVGCGVCWFVAAARAYADAGHERHRDGRAEPLPHVHRHRPACHRRQGKLLALHAAVKPLTRPFSKEFKRIQENSREFKTLPPNSRGRREESAEDENGPSSP